SNAGWAESVRGIDLRGLEKLYHYQKRLISGLKKGKAMNRQIAGMLVLMILVGTVVGAAGADVPDEWKSLDVSGLTALARQFAAKGDAGVDDCKALAAYVGQRYATSSADGAGPYGRVDWNEWLGLAEALWKYLPDEARTAMA
ncbi:MAG: hypothetical protein SVV80_13670, partial [Planctomycetota bacterium]|nr:hypothetical protein [Planctomycetota bacterium]